MLDVTLVGGDVLTPSGLQSVDIGLGAGLICDAHPARRVDVSGYKVLPGIIDVHGDAFERHVAPRRGAMKDVGEGIRAAEAEMAANGITTGVLAQFISWEGGVRGPEFANQVFNAIRDTPTLTDLRAQLRFEFHLLELYDALPQQIAEWGLSYVVFNDHLPHDRLAAGKLPRQLTGQALRAGRSPDAHVALLNDLHARRGEVPDALAMLCPKLADLGVRMGSHDDHTAAERETWMARGCEVAEFPETLEAAEAPGLVVSGAPNLVRGGSHKGNVSAVDVVMCQACDALASDYHYPSLRRAALFIAKTIGLPDAWALVSSGPAQVLGLSDRGQIAPDFRADLVVLDADDRVAGTVSGGQVTYLTGDLVARFLG